MTKDPKKIESTISEKRIKLHIFEPSKRKIWTVVGKGKEHWLDPELEFCSCPSYYFNSINKKKTCYHLEALQTAKNEDKVELITFSDDEFLDFVNGIILDL